jgi:flavin reductase (DIM6/NTAB) family NADH-FMN oxidoreductase RutF
LRTRVGVTGAPILLDALTFVEARVLRSLDNEENTFFVGDVVAAGRLNAGGKLDMTHCVYEQLDDRTTRVTGSRFLPDAKVRVKLEGF